MAAVSDAVFRRSAGVVAPAVAAGTAVVAGTALALGTAGASGATGGVCESASVKVRHT